MLGVRHGAPISPRLVIYRMGIKRHPGLTGPPCRGNEILRFTGVAACPRRGHAEHRSSFPGWVLIGDMVEEAKKQVSRDELEKGPLHRSGLPTRSATRRSWVAVGSHWPQSENVAQLLAICQAGFQVNHPVHTRLHLVRQAMIEPLKESGVSEKGSPETLGSHRLRGLMCQAASRDGPLPTSPPDTHCVPDRRCSGPV